MRDLISRQAAIDAVISLCDDCDSGYCGSCRVNYPGEKDVRKVLEDLPPAQSERKRGRWIVRYECPNCGEERSYAFDTCPICGAKMERSDNGSK